MTICLIVDDDNVSRSVATVVLEDMEIEVNEVTNGIEAINYCSAKKPDIILLDWMMPEMTGIEFLQTVKKMYKKDMPYIILCSARAYEEDIKEAIDSGADAYFVKPFDPEKLYEALKNFTHK